MEQLTQRIFETTLVTVIKGVAIAGLLADVAMFYTSRNTTKLSGIVCKKFSFSRNSELEKQLDAISS